MKKHIILLLKTLINNNACVEAARTREKKYNIIGPILAFFALFFCALPVCVKGFQVNGKDVASTSYGVDHGLYQFVEDTKVDPTHSNFSLTIKNVNGKNVLDMDNTRWKGNGNKWECFNQDGATKAEEGKASKLTNLYRYTYIDKKEEESSANVNWLEIYFTEKTGTDFENYYINIANNKNPEKTDENMKISTDGKKTALTRNTSFIVFGKEEVFIAIYSKLSSPSVSSIRGDYQNTKAGTDLFKDYFVKGDSAKTLDNWKVFFNECYINTRWNNTWKQTGINLGINGGVIILMGFVIWVTTRGKNNPFRIYSYWDSQKICFYACFTPGLIGLFGFLSTSLATMIFAMTCGVRVLWLSMRTLKYTAPAK